MDASKARKVVVFKKSFMAEETSNAIREIVPDEKHDRRRKFVKIRRMPPSDGQKMHGWMLNSDQDRNQRDDDSKSSVPEETNNIVVSEIVPHENNDRRGKFIKIRKLSDRQEMSGWMFNSDHDHNQKHDDPKPEAVQDVEIKAKFVTVKRMKF